MKVWDVAPDGTVALGRRLDFEWLGKRSPGNEPSLQFSPDSNRLVLMAEGGTQVWHLTGDGPPLNLPDGLADGRPCFSPDGGRLAGVVEGARWGDFSQAVKVWDLSSGHELLTVPLSPVVGVTIGMHFDGRQLRLVDRDAKGWFVRVLDGTPRPRAKTP